MDDKPYVLLDLMIMIPNRLLRHKIATQNSAQESLEKVGPWASRRRDLNPRSADNSLSGAQIRISRYAELSHGGQAYYV
jgi:hypothetical protein